jgi:GNAT superfamily N-acetyltransferase
MDAFSLATERTERAALMDIHAAAPLDARAALGMEGETIGSAYLSLTRNDPNVMFNRTIGLGLETEASRQEVRDLVARYKEAGIARFFIHLHPESRPAGLKDWLGEEGLAPTRAWVKFQRDPGNVPSTKTDLSVREIGPEHGADFGRIVATSFGFTNPMAEVYAALAGRDHWHIFMSFDNNQPAGCGALFVHEGLGWLDWGATDPDLRGRGSQGATLAARIEGASIHGCQILAVETGEAVEGDPQHSYHNIERAGFKASHARANYAPPKD